MREKFIFFIISAVVLCLTPILVNAQIFQPTDNYPLSDYQTFGMLFSPKYQKTIENLTKQLLERERSAGYFGGDHQENAIREKVKKHIAMSRGLCDKQSADKDDSPEKAVRVTNEYFKKWREQMPEATNAEVIRAQEEKKYKEASGEIKEQQESMEEYERRRRAPKYYTPEQLEAIYGALDAKHRSLDAIDRQKAMKLKHETCHDFCNYYHFGRFYLDCMERCKNQ